MECSVIIGDPSRQSDKRDKVKEAVTAATLMSIALYRDSLDILKMVKMLREKFSVDAETEELEDTLIRFLELSDEDKESIVIECTRAKFDISCLLEGIDTTPRSKVCLDKQLKYCKNPMEKQAILDDLGLYNSYCGKHRHGKVHKRKK